MIRNLLVTLMLITTGASYAQLPSCVKEKCDSILQSELGKKIFAKSVNFQDFECTKKLDTINNNPCEAYSRHSYLVRYQFAFPKREKATFTLGFVCTGYFGQMHIQSEYFLRTDQSDLPPGFKPKKQRIIKYEKIKERAFEKDSLIRGEGELTLSQNKLHWVFYGYETFKNPHVIGAESHISHAVWLDPYTGKVINHQIRRE